MIVGIDPGNESAGISVWAPIEDDLGWGYAPTLSATVNPWTLEFAPSTWVLEGLADPVDCRVYVEVPQNGTHSSRGGVHWSAGMIVARLLPAMGFGRRDVKKVTPSRWRREVFEKRPEDWKVEARELARLLGVEYGSTDEAEAICIALAGVNMSGRQLHSDVAEALKELR